MSEIEIEDCSRDRGFAEEMEWIVGDVTRALNSHDRERRGVFVSQVIHALRNFESYYED